MKKIAKILSLILITAIISSSIVYQQAEAKDIYFAGVYKSGKYVISLEQYSEKSSYIKGEKCGNMTLTYEGYPLMGGYTHGEIVYEGTTIKKIGKNKYKTKNAGLSGYACIITVKQKSISVKFVSPKGAWKIGKNGTYKLKKRITY